jgi:hypothetical protein
MAQETSRQNKSIYLSLLGWLVEFNVKTSVNSTVNIRPDYVQTFSKDPVSTKEFVQVIYINFFTILNQ